MTPPLQTATRKRFTSAEVRQRVLDAARADIEANGLSVSFDHLPLEEYIRRADVPRTSTYRIWNSRERFVADLLHDMFAGESNFAVEEFAGTGDIEEHLRLVAGTLTTPERRREAFRTCMRIAGDAQSRIVVDSRNWRSFMLATACVSSVQPGAPREAMEQVIAEVMLRVTTMMSQWYVALIERMGCRLRDGVTPAAFASVVRGVLGSLAQQQQQNPAVAGTALVETGPSGEQRAWSLTAIVFAGAVEPLVDFGE